MSEQNGKRERNTGSLRLRGGVFWLRYSHDGKRFEQSTGIRDDGTDDARRRALSKLREKTKTTDTEAFIPPKATTLTFERLWALRVADAVERGNKTVGRLAAQGQHLAEHFAGQRAVRITTARVKEYVIARRQAGAKQATINLELADLRRAFAVAVEQDEFPLSRVPKISTPDPKNVRRVFLDPPDAAAFLHELRATDPVIADAVLVAVLTALRRENVLAMEWAWFSFPPVKDGHLTGGSVTVPGIVTKNGDPLSLPLSGELLAAIDRRWQERRGRWVFHHAGRRAGCWRQFLRTWDAAAAAIGRGGRGADGKRRFYFHDLRRSSARMLRRAGVDQVTIMARGGWKTASMFERYSITDERDQLDASAAADRALAVPAAPRVQRLRS